MSISNYAELKVLDHLTGRLAWTAPTNVYVKLHIGDPGEDCTSNAAAQTTRKVLTFSAAATGAIATSTTPAAEWTSLAAAETLSHWSLWDNLTAGNALWSGALSSSATVAIGDTFQITTLTLTLD